MTDPSALDYTDPAYCDHGGMNYDDAEGRLRCGNCGALVEFDDWSE